MEIVKPVKLVTGLLEQIVCSYLQIAQKLMQMEFAWCVTMVIVLLEINVWFSLLIV